MSYVGIILFDEVLNHLSLTCDFIQSKLLSSTITKSLFIVANSTYPDETPRFAASHLGLRCL